MIIPMNEIARAAALEARWGRAGTVTFEERLVGPVAILSAGSARAAVAVYGAQVLSYCPFAGREVLWVAPMRDFTPGKAIRGGIPICWPWFGPHPRDATMPAHGIARTRPWRVVGSAASAERARIVLALDGQSVTPAKHTLPAAAEVEITLGADTLEVSLTTENRSPAPLTLSEALHTYLAVSDVAGVRVFGLEKRAFLDQLSGDVRGAENRALDVDREIDRIYFDTPDTVTVEDRRFARRIAIAKRGSASTVVWNPWIEKSARLGDMGADGYRRMLCVETANAGKDTVTLAAGGRHRMVAKIGAERT